MAIFKKYVTMDQVKSAFGTLGEPNNTDLAKFVANGVIAIKQKQENAASLRLTNFNLVNQAKAIRVATSETATVELDKAKDAYHLVDFLGLRAKSLMQLAAAKDLDKNPSMVTLLEFAKVDRDVLTKMAVAGHAGTIEADRLEADAKEALEKANEIFAKSITIAGQTFTQAVKDASVYLDKAALLDAEAEKISKGVKFFSA